MILKVYNDDGSINTHRITKELFYDKEYEGKISYISSSTKEEDALSIFKSYYSNAKSILFDNTNKAIIQKLHSENINSFKDNKYDNNIFSSKEFSFTYFTSGTTGLPVGALKTNENIIEEVKVLSKLFSQYTIKRVIVTVPFIHFYGSLMGLMFPLFNDIDIIFKEHFLPNDLVDLIEDNSLVVTTPLYIKALNRIKEIKDLSQSIFLSSTAPLSPNIAKEFNEKFNCNIIQLFGSTETGGIAYKYNDESLWTALDKVDTSVNEHNELKVSSPFISSTLYEKEFKLTQGEIQTFDYIELVDNKFKLIGRSSQILKVAGKRYSTIQIENILEKQEDIARAIALINTKKDELRGESLNIILETQRKYLTKEIKEIIQNELSNIKFSITLKIVDKIETSCVGKKIIGL